MTSAPPPPPGDNSPYPSNQPAGNPPPAGPPANPQGPPQGAPYGQPTSPYGPPSGAPSGAPSGPPQGQPSPYGQAPSPYGPPGGAYGAPPVGGPAVPGSRVYVEQNYGPTTEFTDRIAPYLIDYAIQTVILFVGYFVGVGFLVGSNGGGASAIGLLMIFLGLGGSFAFWFWNRIYRVTQTGQSIGRKMMGLKVIDAATGQHPAMGAQFLRELISSLLGIISAIFMLFDDQRQTLGDKIGKTQVIKVPKG